MGSEVIVVSLTARWTLTLVLATVLLVGGLGLAVQWLLRGEQSRAHRSWQADRAAELLVRLELWSQQSLAQVSLVIDDASLREVLGATVLGGPNARRAAVDWAAAHVDDFELDQILVLDERGRVVSSAIHPASFDQTHPQARYLQQCLARAPVLWTAWRPEGGQRHLGGVGTLRVEGRTFLVAAGRRANDAVLGDLGALAQWDDLHWGEAGPREQQFVPPAQWQLPERLALAATPRPSPAVDALARLRRRFALLAGVVLAAMLLVLPFLARGLAGPMTQLARAAEKLGSGSLDLDLPEAGPREIRELSHALVTMTTSLRDAQARLRVVERRAAWREIAQRIAHEIKNALSPLALAIDNVETLAGRERVVDETALRRSLVTAREQLQSLDRMVREFREFARTPQLMVAPIDPAHVVESAVRASQAVFPAHTIEIVGRESLPDVHGDAEQLQRALQNLLLNAAQARAGGRVEVAYGSGPGSSRWWLAVRDEGPGLDPSIAARLGEPYLTTKPAGHGLGLAVVVQIAEAHGGRLQPRPRSTGGLEMRLELATRPTATEEVPA